MDKTAYMGERSHYYVTLDGKPEPVAVSSTNQFVARDDDRWKQGEPVWLSWSPEAVVVLDAD